ncbi:hypothetical protein CAPTEDRAFT_192332 [Capitella teleta]|uniref:G-protein coupled receptors family 1 profile domain-containing protein n=1 Tax=Capitella teleta TaxID=283909 RepID=R7UCP1_CAPTE|nr:hypothetical protein CAPTEDRAFT_192332 [Capitella teleta]|eukprot:ELU03764.1 hypothetical protein CAPTEDRAFT_192332 [Capitella teleta]
MGKTVTCSKLRREKIGVEMQTSGWQLGAVIMLTTVLSTTADNISVAEWTTTAPGQSDHPRASIYWGRWTADITFYGFTMVGVLSVVCNGLNMWVFNRQQTMSPHVYMIALAMCNFIAGICIIGNTMMVNKQLLRQHQWLREMTTRAHLPCYYVRYTLDNAATYLLNALSLDRLLAIRHPMHRVLWCTSRRAMICSVLLLLLCVGINSHMLVRLHVVLVPDDLCDLPVISYTEIGQDRNINKITMYMRLILQQGIPLTMMVITNSWTIYEITKSIKFRKQNSDQGGQQGVQCLGMTLGVTIVFVITQIPATSYSLSVVINGTSVATSEAQGVAIVLSEIVRWCKTFVNFFVYLIIDKKFRRDLSRICKPGSCQKGPETTTTNEIRLNQC